jgi:hypothetical protein
LPDRAPPAPGRHWPSPLRLGSQYFALRPGCRQCRGITLQGCLPLGDVSLGLLRPLGGPKALLRQFGKAVELLRREGQAAAVAFDIGLVRRDHPALLGQLRFGDGLRCLRALQVRGGNVKGGLKVPRIQFDQQLAGREGTVVGHVKGGNISGDLWNHRDGVRLEGRVVGLDDIKARNLDVGRYGNQSAADCQRPDGNTQTRFPGLGRLPPLDVAEGGFLGTLAGGHVDPP